MDPRIATDELAFHLMIRNLWPRAPHHELEISVHATDNITPPTILAHTNNYDNNPNATPASYEVCAGAESPLTNSKLLELLTSRGATFRTLEHAPTRTSEEVSNHEVSVLARLGCTEYPYIVDY